MGAIWITGGMGFLGRHLARLADEHGYAVVGIGHGPGPGPTNRDADQWPYTHWRDGEIESPSLSELADASGPPDTIFHLAGGSSVGGSFKDPYADFSRTVESTARLLEWVRLNSCASRVVTVSSAAVYGGAHSGLIPEDAARAPASPYGFHKSMVEDLCRSYGTAFNLRVSIVRLFSVYGPGLERQLVWDICAKLAGNPDTLVLDGTGNEIRDWMFVSDAVALLWIARDTCASTCPVMNGGTGVGTRIHELAKLVCLHWGAQPTIAYSGNIRPGDPPSLVADVAVAQRMGFRVATGLRGGLNTTVEWFKGRCRIV